MKQKNNTLNGMSLFSGGGLGEVYLEDVGIDIKVANEFLKSRADFYSYQHPNATMVCKDITEEETQKELIKLGKKNKVNFLIATPPCQGMSNLGKREYELDERNYLVFPVLEIIDNLSFDYILIENVPRFLKMEYPYNGKQTLLMDMLIDKYSDKYEIDGRVLDAQNYGVPQRRKRAIIRMWKKGLKWGLPSTTPPITLREAIGDLPSIESGEKSGILYHDAPTLPKRHIEMLHHTPTGKSGHSNDVYYPKTNTGRRCKGYQNTYRRLDWDAVCPTRTMNSGSVSGSNNCHPGRELPDGTFSDARVLSLLELFIVSSLPRDWDIPTNNEKLIRDIVGEGIPPMLTKNICSMIGK